MDKVLVGIVICVILLIAGTVTASFWYEGFLCKQGFVGIQTKWNYFSGCQVETKPGVWIPRENYRSE